MRARAVPDLSGAGKAGDRVAGKKRAGTAGTGCPEPSPGAGGTMKRREGEGSGWLGCPTRA